MSSEPLSLVEPDSIHIATMIIRTPNGTKAIRRDAAGLDEDRGHEERADEERATWQQEQAGIGECERENGHGKGQDQERAAEQCGTGHKADDKGERKIVRPEQAEIEQALAFGHHLLAEKCQHVGRRSSVIGSLTAVIDVAGLGRAHGDRPVGKSRTIAW